MVTKTLTCAVIAQDFPAGTVEEAFVAAVTGTLADGSTFNQSFAAGGATIVVDLNPGTYTYVITKNGVSSLPSDAFSVVSAPATVSLSVPDPTQKAVVPS